MLTTRALSRARRLCRAASSTPYIRSSAVSDFRSDTVTRPTSAMGLAMLDAAVGDDVYREDPTVNELERVAAALVDKEAALYCPTTTMSNLLAIGAHCARGDEVFLGDESHVFIYEQGGASWLMGAPFHTLPNAPDGTISLPALDTALTLRGGGTDVHFPRPGLLTLENTHNRCGGAVLPAAYMDDAGALARAHRIPFHVDGARLLNASTSLGISPARLTRSASSVSLCLSKALGAPMGSLLIGSASFIASARRLRKAVGGGMRQAGVVAAAGLVALKEQAPLLHVDHTRARDLAERLRAISGVRPQEMVQSNIVFVSIDDTRISGDAWRARVSAAGPGAASITDDVTGVVVPIDAVPPGAPTAVVFSALLAEVANVRVGSYGTSRLRFVTHHQVSEEHCDAAVAGARIAARLMRVAGSDGGVLMAEGSVTGRGGGGSEGSVTATPATAAAATLPPAPASHEQRALPKFIRSAGSPGAGTGSRDMPPSTPISGICDVTLHSPGNDPVWSLGVLPSPDGRLVSGHASGLIRVWSSSRDAIDGVLAAPPNEGSGSAYDLEGRGDEIPPMHSDGVWSLAVLPGRVASGSRDDTVRVWHVGSGLCEATLDEHTRGVSSLAVLRDGRLAIAGYDARVKVWDLSGGASTATPAVDYLLKQPGVVRSLVALPNGGCATGAIDGSIHVWTAGGDLISTLGGKGFGDVWSLCALKDGRLVSGHGSGTYGGRGEHPIRVWSASRGGGSGWELDAELLSGHEGGIDALAALPDGRIVSGSFSSAKIWGKDALEARKGARVLANKATPLMGHTNWVGSVAVLLDGRLATGSWDGTIRVWK